MCRVIADVLHFSFTVSDIERSVDWYARVLGLELVHRQRQDNAYTRALVGIEDTVLEVAQFVVPGVPPARSTHMLELAEYVSPKPDGVPELPTNHADGVRVNCVAPGIVETPMLDAYNDDQRATMRAAIPMGRYAEAREIGETVANLLSEQASYLTGQTLNVNSGRL